jgi:hypothetical protein
MGDMDGTPPSSIGLAAINSTLNIKKAQYLFLNVSLRGVLPVQGRTPRNDQGRFMNRPYGDISNPSAEGHLRFSLITG